MPKRTQPVQDPEPMMKVKDEEREGAPEARQASFADLEREHARAVEEGLSAKRKHDRARPAVSVGGSTRARRPRGRSGSESNESSGSRGH